MLCLKIAQLETKVLKSITTKPAQEPQSMKLDFTNKRNIEHLIQKSIAII